jgi:hypothetical protein
MDKEKFSYDVPYFGRPIPILCGNFHRLIRHPGFIRIANGNESETQKFVRSVHFVKE